MRKKLMIVGVAGLILLGGAIGAGAFSDAKESGNQSPNNPFVSMNQTKDVVASKVDHSIKTAKLESENGHLSYELELDDDRMISNNGIQLTKEDAIAIALNDTPGNVTKVEYEHGEYEIEILTAAQEVKYEIDAGTGTIREKDIDRLDDDDRYDD